MGYARGKKFIPHDDDIDASYVIAADAISEVSDHFFELVESIRSDGHYCHPISAGHMDLRILGETESTDIFTSWHQSDSTFNSFFAVSGPIQEPIAFFEDQMEGITMNIPKQYEDLLCLTYGKNWKVPDPSFQFFVQKEIEKLMRELVDYGKSRCGELARFK